MGKIKPSLPQFISYQMHPEKAIDLDDKLGHEVRRKIGFIRTTSLIYKSNNNPDL